VSHQADAGKSGPKSGNRPGTFTGKGDPRNGHGPLKGAPLAGRPPEEFRAALRALVNRPDVIQRIESLLTDWTTSDSDFLAAYKYACDRAYGRVPTVIEGGDERKPLVIRLVREGRS
jgi:hypothetical protein